MLRIFLTLLCVLGALCPANASPPRLATVPRVAPPPPRTVIVDGHPIREEAGISHGGYLGPNEHLGHVYNPILKRLSRDGVIISIGTTRAIDRSVRLRRG